MNKFVVAVVASLLLVLSGCTIIAENNKQTTEKLDAQSVLKKSVEEMKTLKGYKWQTTAQQNVKASEPGVYANTKVNGNVDYINEVTFRADLGMSADFYDNTRENISYELVAKDQMVYIKDGYTNQWVKTKMTPDMLELFLGLDQEYSNPQFLLEKMLIDVKDVNMTEQSDSYILELTLIDPNRIKPYMEYALRNWEKDPSVKYDQVKFNAFKITLHINREDFTLNNVEQDVKINIPVTVAPEASINLDQKMSLDFKGEVTNITVPSEAESAQEVNPGSENKNVPGGAYKPGDIFKGIDGGINPEFGGSSGSSGNQDKDVIVDPSFGSY